MATRKPKISAPPTGATPPPPDENKDGRGKNVMLFTKGVEGHPDVLVAVAGFPKNLSTEAQARSWIGKNCLEGYYYIMRPVGNPVQVKTVTQTKLF
jgi:hypothetical protein